MGSKKKRKTREYTGIPASPGIAIGQAYIYDNVNFWIEEKDIPDDQIDHEKVRFINSVEQVIKDI